MSGEDDGTGIGQVTVEAGNLFLGGSDAEGVAVAGDGAVVAGDGPVGMLYDKGVGEQGLADELEDFVDVVVLGIDRLPVTYHVDILLSDDEAAGVVQLGVGVAETQGIQAASTVSPLPRTA